MESLSIIVTHSQCYNGMMKTNDQTEIERRAAIVSEQCGGIVPYNEAFYIHSILYSAEQSLRGFGRYLQMLNREQPDPEPDALIGTIQNAIGHSAALSRYFWPSAMGKKNTQRQLRADRGAKLRVAFALEDASPLHNRALRDAWEHFDERLDIYLLENEGGYYFPTCLIAPHTLADDPAGHIFKLLDIDNECLVLMGEKYFFGPLWDEVNRIYNHCLKCSKESRLVAYGRT